MSKDILKCTTPDCENIIQPATAKRTGGYCGPCNGKILQAQRAEYIQQNRRDVNLYAGITDTADIILIAHEDRLHDPLIHYLPPPRPIDELYASLTLPQAKKLMHIAAQSLKNGARHPAEDLALHLAAFTDFDLDSMLKTWVELNHFWLPLTFRSAGPEIRDGILEALYKKNVNANHALQAVAWIGDETVVKAFSSFTNAPLAWAKDLHIPASQYTRVAAWEIDAGKRRELSLPGCFSITPDLQSSETADVRLFQPTQESCPWCASPLVNLLQINERASAFSLLGISGALFEVKTCSKCTGFGVIFGELDDAGNGRLAQNNTPPQFTSGDWDPSPWSNIAITLRPRRPIHAAAPYLSTTFSQIGGLPAWIQDFDFPSCCKCGQTMLFIAQIDNGHFSMYEGVYYAFLCRTCRVTATTYQQT